MRIDTPIVVLGAGVVGLTTAIELASRGARVVVASPPAREGIASWVAPALFTPYPGLGGERFHRWATRSFDRLRALADDPATGVRMGEAREFRTRPLRSEPWLDALLAKRPRPAPPPYVEGSSSVRPHIDTTRYMPWLGARARELGVVFVERTVRALDEAFALGGGEPARVVVHCAGVGARALAADPLVRPVHGQVLHTPNDVGLGYSIQDDSRDGHVTYVFNFGDRLVLGGTFEADRDDARVERAALDALVSRCRELLRLDGFARWAEVGRVELLALGGVRPTRGPEGHYEHTRVEVEPRPGGRAIVHHYGHGRAGISLSWGSAVDAAERALQA